MGPMGTAAGAAAGILASALIPYIFSTGEESDAAQAKVKGLTEALEALGQVKLDDRTVALQEMSDLEVKIRTLESQRGQAGTRGDVLRRAREITDAKAAMAKIQDRLDRADVIQNAQARIDATYSKDGKTNGKTKPAKIKEDADLAIMSVGSLAQALGQLDVSALLKANGYSSWEQATGVEGGDIGKIAAAIDARKNAEFKATQTVEDDRLAKQEQTVRTVADLYEQAMLGGTDSIGKALKSVLIRSIAEALATQMFGSAGAKSGGFFGNLLGGIGSAFGGFRAAGGPVSAGKSYVVGERGPEVLHMRAPGYVTPNAPGRAARSGGGTTIVNHFTLDMKGAITTPELIAGINTAISQAERRAVATSLAAGEKAMPGRIARFNTLGS
jgi:hypothetical protein